MNIVKNFLIVLKVYDRCNKNCFKKSGLIGNEIADKIDSFSKKSSQNVLKTDENELEIPKERYISPEKRQKIIDEIRLV